MKRIIMMFLILCLFLISSCSPQSTPAATPTQPPTPTVTPKPFTGKLFFDMNGSGLQDESSFIYDPERLADPRQPLQPDLDKAIKDYVAAHPNLKKGDIVTISEPGLSGYKVCIEQECATTLSDGSFSISNSAGSTNPLLKITDPYADKPALAMRYINEWKGVVTIPAYEVKDAKISEQRLNDTMIIPIAKSIYTQSGQENNIGLIQGFLTSPFDAKDSTNIYIWGFWDDANNYITCGKPAKPNGIAISYDGKFTREGGGNPIRPSIGVGDSHDGYDYSVPVGTFIYNTGPFGKV